MADEKDDESESDMPPGYPTRPTYSEDGVDLTLVRWMLSLTPEERLDVLQAAVDSILSIQDANAKD